MYFFVRNNKEVTLAREEIMPFDRIFDNVGNGFNVSNATFTAPFQRNVSVFRNGDEQGQYERSSAADAERRVPLRGVSLQAKRPNRLLYPNRETQSRYVF